MPKKDGSGPEGKGPMTGRGGGKCIISLNTKEEELDYLKNQKRVLKNELQMVEKEFGELKDQLQQIDSRINKIKTTASGSEK